MNDGGDSATKGDASSPSRTVGSPINATPEDTNSTRASNRNYTTTTCSDYDLMNLIWPGDALARKMLRHVRQTLLDDAHPKEIRALLEDYFSTKTPKMAIVFLNYKRLSEAFERGDYRWKCVDCPRGKFGGTFFIPLVGCVLPMKLCVLNLRKFPLEGTAKTMIHEMGHYALDLDDIDDVGYCASDPSAPDGCPTLLTEEEALKNADSYACFAVAVWKRWPPS